MATPEEKRRYRAALARIGATDDAIVSDVFKRVHDIAADVDKADEQPTATATTVAHKVLELAADLLPGEITARKVRGNKPNKDVDNMRLAQIFLDRWADRPEGSRKTATALKHEIGRAYGLKPNTALKRINKGLKLLKK